MPAVAGCACVCAHPTMDTTPAASSRLVRTRLHEMLIPILFILPRANDTLHGASHAVNEEKAEEGNVPRIGD
jgi:hypothetical protein